MDGLVFNKKWLPDSRIERRLKLITSKLLGTYIRRGIDDHIIIFSFRYWALPAIVNLRSGRSWIRRYMCHNIATLIQYQNTHSISRYKSTKRSVLQL